MRSHQQRPAGCGDRHRQATLLRLAYRFALGVVKQRDHTFMIHSAAFIPDPISELKQFNYPRLQLWKLVRWN
jgi:hypothetical protein